jgi:hypothetical protein
MQAPVDDLAVVRTRLAQLEDRVHKAKAIRDIKRVQYSYAHYAEAGLWLDLGDLFAKDGVAHYVQGDYKGPESLRKFYLQELGRGQLGLAEGRIYPHIMIQPVVTVADDGKSAKGRWHVIAMLGGYGTSASWAGVVYENRYILEDGVWKINELSFASQYSGRYVAPGLTISKWNLPVHYTEQSVGDPAPKSASLSAGSATLEELQRRYVELARRVQELRDEADVLNLQHSYGYAFDQKNWAEAANLFANDGTLELGQRGVYVGKNRIRRALSTISGQQLSADEVNDHLQLATVVHIAPDGRAAKARGVELAVSGVKKQGGQWEEGIFENEYVKQGATWKIRSVHYFPRVITDYGIGWAKDAKPAAKASIEFPPDRPPTTAYEIYPKVYFPPFHYPNPVTASPEKYSPASLPSPPKSAKDINARLNELEPQIHSIIAYESAENLVSALGYSAEDSSQKENASAIHQAVQPVIHVGSDGKSATIRARLLKVGGKAGELAGGIYEGRAIYSGGVWKLLDLTLKPTWSSPFDHWAPVVEPRRLLR